MKIGVLLSGCGVYDGAEVQEATLALLAIAENGHEAICMAPNINQHHVINHLSGDEMNEKRNVLVESSRIARGEVTDVSKIEHADLDALVLIGGFGTAKNLTKWAFQGPEGEILPEIKLLLVNLVNIGKPIVGLCMGPVVIAKALEGSLVQAKLSVGSTKAASPYDIDSISKGMESIGVKTEMTTIEEISVDEENKIICAPCYMMDASILEIRNNVKAAIDALEGLL